MKILNIHGLDGKFNNTNYGLLCDMFRKEDIISPQLDYRNDHISYIFHKLDTLIYDKADEEGIDFVVGTSFGGFVAICLALRYRIPCILINPCLRPDISVEKLSPGYMQRNEMSLIPRIRNIRVDSFYDFKNVHVIMGDNDKVIDTNLSLEILHKHEEITDVVTIPGGHQVSSLSEENLKREFYRMVSEIIKR